MVTERVDICIIAGRETEFEAAMNQGCALLAAAHGCTSVALTRCVERPERYMLQLNWDSLADHQAFTKTPGFQAFRDLAGGFFSERPTMEHFHPLAV
jgi:heme-degrading monooxygenase HmoA